MAFDLTVNLGHILTAAIVAVIGYLMRTTVTSFERRMTEVEGNIKELNRVVVAAARFEERLSSMRSELSSFMTTQMQSHTEWRQWVRGRFETLEKERTERRAWVDRKLLEAAQHKPME
jgi:hypothetical protein